MENHHFQWVNPLKWAMFNSYVSLPEGINPSCSINFWHRLANNAEASLGWFGFKRRFGFPLRACTKHILYSYTLWLFNIAMENGPFIDDFPIKTSIYKGFSMAMLNNQRVYIYIIIYWLFTDNRIHKGLSKNRAPLNSIDLLATYWRVFGEIGHSEGIRHFRHIHICIL